MSYSRGCTTRPYPNSEGRTPKPESARLGGEAGEFRQYAADRDRECLRLRLAGQRHDPDHHAVAVEHRPAAVALEDPGAVQLQHVVVRLRGAGPGLHVGAVDRDLLTHLGERLERQLRLT